MFTQKWIQRPECQEVLAKHKKWTIDRNIIINSTEFEPQIEKLKANAKIFFYEFLTFLMK